MPELSDKRILVLGAETALGRDCARALAASGATLALVAATPDADAAFGVQRLARKLGAGASQAIDATNEAALRVMVRQVGKALCGLDAVVDATGAAGTRAAAEAIARREMDRTGGGVYVIAIEPGEIVRTVAGEGA